MSKHVLGAKVMTMMNPLSEYVEGLPEEAKARYKQKNIISMDYILF